MRGLPEQNSGLSSEHEFLLYAVTRRATQESVGASLGKVGSSHVNSESGNDQGQDSDIGMQ